MYFKKMVGEKCYLSPINVEDYQECTKWINDMEASIGMVFASGLITPIQERQILDGLANTDFNFAIVDLETNELVGTIGFPKVDYINRIAEFGIFIGNKEYWRKGYGVEATQLVLDFGFNILNLNNIYLKVYSYNHPAIKCYKKAGFKEAGRIRESKQIAQEKYDEIYMDILAKEFKSIYIKDLVEKRKFK